MKEEGSSCHRSEDPDLELWDSGASLFQPNPALGAPFTSETEAPEAAPAQRWLCAWAEPAVKLLKSWGGQGFPQAQAALVFGSQFSGSCLGEK